MEAGKHRALLILERDSHFGVGLVILGLLKQARLLDFPSYEDPQRLPILCVETHQFDPVIGFRVSRRGTRHEHHSLDSDFVFAQPVCNPFAPVVRFLSEIDRMHTVGEREILTRSAI